jgi:hypothetical protein
MAAPMTRRTSFTAALLVATLLVWLHSTMADAASPPVTAQATAANAAFLAYAPPPPNGAGALCLVDTGVNANADTTPGLVSATALDNGTSDDVDPLGHGTIDAATAGGSGRGGLIGAWPQLKIFSIRATNVPAAGQEPSFEFDDYAKAILQCLTPNSGPPIYAIDLPLSSMIQPSPDETTDFTAAANQAEARGITIIAAAGNDSGGTIELPANEPGIFAVGADQVAGQVSDPTSSGICPLSATAGLTFFAPGCGMDTINPQTDTPVCCGNGTSQASAFTAGVLVALRSYDPALSPTGATQLLLSTVSDGELDVAAAFNAAGLGAVVNAGTAAIPHQPPAAEPTQPPAAESGSSQPPAIAPSKAATLRAPTVRSATWKRGVLRIAVEPIPKGSELHAEITFAHGNALYIATAHASLHRKVRRPQRALLRISKAGVTSVTVPVKL